MSDETTSSGMAPQQPRTVLIVDDGSGEQWKYALAPLRKGVPTFCDKPLAMTASFGVVTISTNDKSIADIVVRADRALYRSKRAGRNRVDLESSQRMQILNPAQEAAGS